MRVVSPPIPLAKKQNANLKSFRHRPQLGHPLRQYTVGKNLTKIKLRAKRAIAGGLAKIAKMRKVANRGQKIRYRATAGGLA